MNIIERAKAPTPKFFKILRAIGFALLGISGTIVASPIVLPSVVVTVAGYLAVAGGVISAVSQVATSEDTGKQVQGNNREDPETLKRVQGKSSG